jgi:hypothetical protein
MAKPSKADEGNSEGVTEPIESNGERILAKEGDRSENAAVQRNDIRAGVGGMVT